MSDPCTIPECVSQTSMRRFSLFKWVTLGLLSLLLVFFLPQFGWRSQEGVVRAVPDISTVVLKTLQFDKLTPVAAGGAMIGSINLAGSGRPDGIVELLHDGATFGNTTIDEHGNWSFHTRLHVRPGQHYFQARIVELHQSSLHVSNLISVVIPAVETSAQTSREVERTETTAITDRTRSTKSDEEERSQKATGERKRDISTTTAITDRTRSTKLGEEERSQTVEREQKGSHAGAVAKAQTTDQTVRETNVTEHEAVDSRVEGRRQTEIHHEHQALKSERVTEHKTATSQVEDRRQAAIHHERQALKSERSQDVLIILGTNRDTTGNHNSGFFGRAHPNTILEIVQGQTVLGTIRVQADGTWRCKCKLPPGNHTLIVRELHRPHVASVPKMLTVANLAPPMILPRVKATRPTGPVKCPDTLPSGDIRGNLYVVGRCETLAFIARHLGTDLSSLMSYNPQIPDANRIYAGQKLNIPATAACLAEDA